MELVFQLFLDFKRHLRVFKKRHRHKAHHDKGKRHNEEKRDEHCSDAGQNVFKHWILLTAWDSSG